ncbi:AAEL007430-PA, partial [Aedes aegypti]
NLNNSNHHNNHHHISIDLPLLQQQLLQRSSRESQVGSTFLEMIVVIGVHCHLESHQLRIPNLLLFLLLLNNNFNHNNNSHSNLSSNSSPNQIRSLSSFHNRNKMNRFKTALNGGFQPIVQQNHNHQTSGSNYHPVANVVSPNNNVQGPGYHYPPPQQVVQQPQKPYVPSTLQQQIVGSQQDPRILKPSQPYHQNNQYRDPEPTTISPGAVPVPGIQNPNGFQDFDYHPCNNVPWVPLEPPPGQLPVTQVPPNAIPEITSPTKRPIKLEIRPKGQVHSVSHYPPSIQNHEPVIITAAPPPQQLIQLQLQQQQQQLQNLQLQQLQLQQQQLQQQLQQLQVSTTAEPSLPPKTTTPFIQTAAPTAAHFVTRKPDSPQPSIAPITFRQVSASYFTNKDYHPPAKILPIQDEGKPHASITLPNLSASPVPPLYTATSFHSDPYKFYRPYKPRDNFIELGYGYPQSLQSMSDSYTRYNRPPYSGNRPNHSIFDVEQVASSSSTVYTTVAYSNDDSKPAASEHRNVTISGTNQLSAEDEDYSSEEDDEQISGVTVTFPVEVTSVVPKTRYYSSRTTTTERPTTFPSSLPPPTDPGELGNGLQIIYSANLHTSSPVKNKHYQRQLPDSELDHPDLRPPESLFNNLLSEEEDSVAKETVPTTISTHAPPTRPVSSILTTLKVTANRPTLFQLYRTTEVPTTENTTPIPRTVTTVPPTASSHLSSMTAAIGGHINTAATKKPKQIQIIIPYSTYKKPEPFKPKDRDEIDHAPAASNIVTSTSGTSTTTAPTKSHFVTRESMKFFHSSTNIKDILRKETTRPFSRPPTTVPEKPTKLKKVEPVKVSKDSKPFTPPRVPKMTPMPPVFNLTGLSADQRLERTTTLPPRTFRPTIIMAHPSRFTPNYINITRMRPVPTTHTYPPRTTISQLLRTTKIHTKPPKPHDDQENPSRSLPPIVYRRTTVPTTTTTTERLDTTPIPIYERNEWDIDPLLLQRRIDTWTEQQYASEDYLFKSSTIPLHRVTKAIPWEFLTTTMLPSLRDRTKGRDTWRNVKIAISPHTKEKVYVVTPQPWTAIINQETVSSPRFSIRPTPFYQKAGFSTISVSRSRGGSSSNSSSSSRGGSSSTGSTVDVSPESGIYGGGWGL